MSGFVLAGALFAVPQLSSQTLLSRYTLNGNANDSGSLGIDGTLVGSPSFVSDAPGEILTQSLDLTGTGSQYLEAAVGANYDGLTALTLTLWVNLKGRGVVNDRLVSNLEATSLDGFDLRFGNGNTSTAFPIPFNVNAATSPANSSTVNTGGGWVFLAVTYNSVGGGVNFNAVPLKGRRSAVSGICA